ncbi:HECT and RLD domain containing E3 ubiquitin protein ligase 4 [Phyllostomus discolor]|uniref:HECT and RLD domain containing E3 ubiquitin protein ligase 4 n=1 Tax=Phyllostomus discolor TaxID=89673 RepID=A0A834AAV7_9CHIR|nr:HECT and RLD domain containing E3 ubiquitin protein ligase 4 [Phyllostomus discolor]
MVQTQLLTNKIGRSLLMLMWITYSINRWLPYLMLFIRAFIKSVEEKSFSSSSLMNYKQWLLETQIMIGRNWKRIQNTKGSIGQNILQ